MNCSYATLLHISVKIVNIILWNKDQMEYDWFIWIRKYKNNIEFTFFFVNFDAKISDYLWFDFTIAFLENTFQDITRFVAYTFMGW